MRPLYCAALLVSAACAAHAQDADSKSTFEVASIKVAAAVDPLSQRMPTPRDPGRFIRRDTPLSILIMTAYHLNGFEYSGPSWLTSARFDITAKVAEGATQAQQMVMLQNLLAERFGLKVHREKREMPAYDLVIAKGGVKFKEYVPPPPPKEGDPPPAPFKFTLDADGYPVAHPGGGWLSMNGKWALHDDITMERFARILMGQLQRPVHDATGLAGTYDLAMRWVEGVDAPSAGAEAGADNAGLAAPSGNGGPGLFAALQSQLGLKLESKKGMAQVLVVDQCERMPAEN
jgi:uncharacterized protein (TIGR03435 family)